MSTRSASVASAGKITPEQQPVEHEIQQAFVGVLDQVPTDSEDASDVKSGRFFFSTLVVVVLSILFIVGFSDLSNLGYGYVFLQMSRKYVAFVWILCGVLGMLLFVMYFFDVEDWGTSTGGRIFRNLWLIVTYVVLALLTLFNPDRIAYGSLLLFNLTLPLGFFLIKYFFYGDENPRDYASSLSRPLLTASCLIFIGFLVVLGIQRDLIWTDLISAEKSIRAGCTPDFTHLPECTDITNTTTCFNIINGTFIPDNSTTCTQKDCLPVYDGCVFPLVMWFWPVMCSTVLFFMSFIVGFFRRKKAEDNEFIVPETFIKIGVVLILLLWLLSGIAGGAAVDGLTGFMLCLCMAAGLAGVLTFSHPKYRKQLTEKCLEKFGDYIDLGQAVLIVTCAPLMVLYFLASFFNQRVRRMRYAICGRSNDSPQSLAAQEWNGWLTEIASQQLEDMKKWEVAKTLDWAVLFGILFFLGAIIASKVTYIGLSSFIESLANEKLPLWLESVIMIFFGLAMFLIPVVPGTPVYLAAGLLLTPKAQETFEGNLYLAIAYICALSTVMKLLACACQQKGIGGLLSHSVYVRQQVKINSNFMRTAKLVLQEPGLAPAKVGILVGGPDWPTSVACGLMGLDLLPIIVGTLPIITIVLPTVLSGSFMVMGAEDPIKYPWATPISAFCLMMSAGTQAAFFFYSASCIEVIMRERKEELEAIPIDQEVKDADDKIAESEQIYLEVTRWDRLPVFIKFSLGVSFIIIVLSCYVGFFLSTRCFVEYTLNDSIDRKLDGSFWNLFKWPAGWAVMIMFGISSVFYLVYYCWAKMKTKKVLLEKIDEEAP